ncbi:MAG: CD225/dispanin family protein [Bacteroidia bacterium]|nr:CD225/dispanin family protein [Bacteroidia bacterium]
MSFSKDSSNISRLKPNTWLWQSIIITLCCSPLFGIIALMNAVQVNSSYNIGNYEKAERVSRRAKTWLLVGLITGIIYYIVMIILMQTGNLPAGMEHILKESQQSIYNY